MSASLPNHYVVNGRKELAHLHHSAAMGRVFEFLDEEEKWKTNPKRRQLETPEGHATLSRRLAFTR